MLIFPSMYQATIVGTSVRPVFAGTDPLVRQR
jgi:hypothetical protein